MTEESIFATALELKTGQERQTYLDQACADNPELRAQVEDLLRANADAGSFLNHPPAGLDATIEATSADDTVNSNGWAGGMPFLEPCDTPGRLGKLVGKAGEYEIIEVVGQGGMGAVLRAFDVKLSRIVAVKVMAPELAANPTAVKRFQREAQSAAAVHHDHVVTIHAVDETHRPPFIVMQFVEGQTLQQKLDREGALELKQILRIGSQMAAGLAAAHKHGLIHRDVKPANVLLENGVERVKITDFGLARAADDLDMTQTGVIAGTPQYMSPEQAKGEPIDTRSDLFSLGSVLYSMCTGRPAFRADNTIAVMRRVCDDTPRAIREVNREIPSWLEAIVSKLLAKNPAERFQSAGEVAELLGQHLAHLQNPAQVVRPATIFTPPPPKGIPTSGDRTADSSAAVVLVVLGVLIGIPVLLVGLFVAGLYSYRSVGMPNRPASVMSFPDGRQADSIIIASSENESRPADSGKGEEVDNSTRPGAPPLAIAPFDNAKARTHQQEWAEYLGVPVEYKHDNGMVFRLIPPGEFLMGGTQEETDALVLALEQGGANDFDKFVARTSAPQHQVRITKPFYLGAHEVTVGQYRQFIEETKHVSSMEQLGIKRFDWTASIAEPDPEQRAVIGVSWDDAKAFCKWLSEKDERTYDLPSEAQWEHACRAGTDTAWSFGGEAAALSEHAVFGQPSFWPAEVVGSRKPNPFGLYDMHGNADEWCLDWHDHRFYANSPVDDPVCLTKPDDKNSGRVARGGTAISAPWWTRSTTRAWDFPQSPVNPKGFRVAIIGDLAGIGTQPTVIARSSRVFTGEMIRDGDTNVFGMAWSAKGDLLATGHYDGPVTVWNLESGEQVQVLAGHTKTVNTLAFSPDGKFLATGGEDSTIRLWNVDTWEEAGQLDGHTGWIACLAFIENGAGLVSVSRDFQKEEDNTIRIWNVAERTERQKITETLGHNTNAALAPDSSLVAIANAASGRVRLWSLASGSPTHDFEGQPTHPVCVAFSRDGTRLAAGYMAKERQDGEYNDPAHSVVRMWDVKSGALLQEFKGHAGPISALEFSPDDRRLLSLASGRHDATSAYVPSSDQSVRIWDVATGQEQLRLEPPTQVHAARWTPDGTAICTGTRLWEIPAVEERAE